MTPTPVRPGGRPRPPGPAIALTALHDLHHDHYLRYAALLLPTTTARLAVHHAFEELTRRWREVLSHASPAACAWQTVRHRVCTMAGPHLLRPVAHLAAPDQDVLLLHLVLRLPPAEVAALTGTDPAAVHVRLRSLTRRSR
ncbi:hypothetical protein ACFVFS_37760 [Kitasatospora sp. NPDC057692]|uniref:hypothetical protein n=1 Tax=Kitasatospora sp. NPDC057692 TaxID=3346215 RepID=UPI0036A691AB